MIAYQCQNCYESWSLAAPTSQCPCCGGHTIKQRTLSSVTVRFVHLPLDGRNTVAQWDCIRLATGDSVYDELANWTRKRAESPVSHARAKQVYKLARQRRLKHPFMRATYKGYAVEAVATKRRADWSVALEVRNDAMGSRATVELKWSALRQMMGKVEQFFLEQRLGAEKGDTDELSHDRNGGCDGIANGDEL